MFDTMRKGLIASMEADDYEPFLKYVNDWTVSANEDEELIFIVGQVNDAEFKKAINPDDIFIDKESNIYDNLKTLFLNGQAEYPKEILMDIIKNDKRFVKYLEYFDKLDLEGVETEVKEQMVEYFEGENYFTLDGEYISLVCFSWYNAGDEAVAWPYRKED